MQYKILIIEDNPENLELITAFLDQINEAYDCFITAEEALETVKENTYKLIMADISLPKMSGLEFIKKAKPFAPNTPFWSLTALALQEELTRIKKAGYEKIFTKPLNLKKLENSLDLIN
eukprot:COSAG01_NODE_69_length_28801_cov_10.460038_8_plen_119_part_00